METAENTDEQNDSTEAATTPEHSAETAIAGETRGDISRLLPEQIRHEPRRSRSVGGGWQVWH